MAFSVLQKQQSQAAHFLIHPPQLKSIETKGHLQVVFFLVSRFVNCWL